MSQLLHRFRVTHIDGASIAKIEVGTVLLQKKPPRKADRDERYPNGFQTWTFMNFKTGETQNVTGEYIGSQIYDDKPAGGVVHVKHSPFDVYIGRAVPRSGFAASKWGNPFKVPKGYDVHADPDRILARYEEHVRSRPDLMAALPELRGKVLGCWCTPKPCHGDVLLRMVSEIEVANG